jgi:hypothetical protein
VYARLSRYVFQVTDQQRWDSAQKREGDTPVFTLLSGLEGCRGVWAMGAPDATGLTEVETVVFSLWDTREQAESVGERAAAQLGTMLDEMGTRIAVPPQVEVFETEGRLV